MESSEGTHALPEGLPVTPVFNYLLSLGDDLLVIGHRLSEWCGHAPELEEDIALANIGLDCLGQATNLLTLAGQIEGQGRDEDRLAFFRNVGEFRNCLLVEQPNGDFAQTMLRQLFFSTYWGLACEQLSSSVLQQLAGICQKSFKEASYHLRHSREWIIRLGDGTKESRRRTQAALDQLWPLTGELFDESESDQAVITAGVGCSKQNLRAKWTHIIGDALSTATLTMPELPPALRHSGRSGYHTEAFGRMLAEMQSLPRAYPDARW